MGEVWFALILIVLLGLYYWSKRSIWITNRLYTDNQILQQFKVENDAHLVEILHECGADTFELKDVSKLPWKEERKYFNDIEHLFDSIESHFRSGCARLLIERRHEDVNYILKIEKHCKNSECKTCELKKMKRSLMNWSIYRNRDYISVPFFIFLIILDF